MENSIRVCSRAIAEANVEITGDRSEHDKMQQRCQALGKALERERKNFHKQTEEGKGLLGRGNREEICRYLRDLRCSDKEKRDGKKHIDDHDQYTYNYIYILGRGRITYRYSIFEIESEDIEMHTSFVAACDAYIEKGKFLRTSRSRSSSRPRRPGSRSC